MNTLDPPTDHRSVPTSDRDQQKLRMVTTVDGLVLKQNGVIQTRLSQFVKDVSIVMSKATRGRKANKQTNKNRGSTVIEQIKS